MREHTQCLRCHEDFINHIEVERGEVIREMTALADGTSRLVKRYHDCDDGGCGAVILIGYEP